MMVDKKTREAAMKAYQAHALAVYKGQAVQKSDDSLSSAVTDFTIKAVGIGAGITVAGFIIAGAGMLYGSSHADDPVDMTAAGNDMYRVTDTRRTDPDGFLNPDHEKETYVVHAAKSVPEAQKTLSKGEKVVTFLAGNKAVITQIAGNRHRSYLQSDTVKLKTSPTLETP